MDLLKLKATLGLDSSEYEKGLTGAKSFASNIGSGIGKAMDVGIKAVAGATAAVGAFGVTSVKTGMEFDSSMSQVAATMGLSMSEMEQSIGSVDTAYGEFSGNLREYAQFMGAKTAFSAKQAADALNYMALAGYDAQTSMEMLPNVLNLAAAGGMELATASDMVTDAQSALGLSLEETSEMVDKMAKASSKSNTSVQQLGEAFLTVGGTAKNLKGGTTELATALGVLADNGVKGAEGGTALRNIILSLSAPTDKAKGAIKDLGLSVFDANGNMRDMNSIFGDLNGALNSMTQQQKTEVLNTIFNKVDLKSVNALLSATNDEFKNLYYSMETYEGLAEAGFKGIGDPLGSFGVSAEKLAQHLQEAGDKQSFVNTMVSEYDMKAEQAEFTWDKFSGVALDTANRFDELTGYIDDATGAAQKMADTQLDNLAGDITLFQSALEGTQIALSDKLTPTLRGFVEDATKGLSDVATAITEGDWDGATDAIGDFLSNSLNTIVKGLPQFINAGMQILGSLGQGIIDNIPTIVDSGVQIVVQLTNGLVQALPQLAEGAITLVQSLGQSFTENAPQLLDAGMQLVQMIADGIVSGIPILIEQGLPMLVDFSAGLRENAGDLVDAGIDLIMKIADGLIEGLPTMIETIPDIIINIAGVINDNAPKLLVAGVQLIVKLGEGIIKSIPTLVANIPKIFEAILAVWTALNWINLGTNVINFISDGIKSLAQNIPNALKDIGSKAVDWFKLIQWKTLGQDVIDLIKIGIEALASAIPNALKSIATTAMNAFKNLDWKSIGTNVIKGIAAGISGGVRIIADAAKDAAKAAFNAAKDFLGIKSPSKLMRDQVGRYISEGIAVGIDQNVSSIEDSMRGISDLVSQPIDVGEVGMTGGSGSGSAYNSSNSVVINVYGSVGQNVNELAEIVSRKINASVNRRGAAWA